MRCIIMFYYVHLYLALAQILFVIGVIGVFVTKKNIIVILMSIEIMLLSINLNFIIYSTHFNDSIGQLFSLMILTVAAAEAAIGLAILIAFYRLRGTISIADISSLKG